MFLLRGFRASAVLFASGRLEGRVLRTKVEITARPPMHWSKEHRVQFVENEELVLRSMAKVFRRYKHRPLTISKANSMAMCSCISYFVGVFCARRVGHFVSDDPGLPVPTVRYVWVYLPQIALTNLTLEENVGANRKLCTKGCWSMEYCGSKAPVVIKLDPGDPALFAAGQGQARPRRLLGSRPRPSARERPELVGHAFREPTARR